MNHEDQLALIDRIKTHCDAGRGTDTAAESKLVPTANYTDPERFLAERKLINSEPNMVALSGVLPAPGTFATVMVLSLIHISEPTRRTPISYAVFCLKKKK